jgi:3D (Asp-Asp-Asp) domain-containing protein
MRTLALLIVAFLVFMFATDTVLGLAREFEHGLDSKIEKPEKETQEHKYHSMIATAYCLTGSTATGTTPRTGIAASRPAWFGKTVKVYWNDGGKPGAMIGTYTVEDTGGAPIRNGSVIDIWMPTEDECFEFGRRCVLVEVME